LIDVTPSETIAAYEVIKLITKVAVAIIEYAMEDEEAN
jgi:hypothetical protein